MLIYIPTLSMTQHNYILKHNIWTIDTIENKSHAVLQHICAINILCNKSGFRGVAFESSVRGYWHNGILVHGATWLARGKRVTAQIAVTVRGTRRINTPNPLGDQRLAVQKWPEVCVVPQQEGNMVSRWVSDELQLFHMAFFISYWLTKVASGDSVFENELPQCDFYTVT